MGPPGLRSPSQRAAEETAELGPPAKVFFLTRLLFLFASFILHLHTFAPPLPTTMKIDRYTVEEMRTPVMMQSYHEPTRRLWHQEREIDYEWGPEMLVPSSIQPHSTIASTST